MSALLFIDKYQIIKPLGSGNFGQVYHVFDRALSAEKALKVLEATNPANFMKNLDTNISLPSMRQIFSMLMVSVELFWT
jgi:serine/threonine protein kinase